MKPNPFRPQYRELTEDEKARIGGIKDEAKYLHDLLLEMPEGTDQRQMALARTKLEECVMWATKAITG